MPHPKAPDTGRVPLQRGESRTVRVLPCPPDWMHRTNAYWQLRRAARRLWERMFELAWDGGGKNELDAIDLLRKLAEEQPVQPIDRWFKEGMGCVREICCPTCGTVFEWQGNFYSPKCPNCNAFLQSRREVTERVPDAGSTQTEGRLPGMSSASGQSL